MSDDNPPAADPAGPTEPCVPPRPGLSDRVWLPLLSVALVVLLLAVGWTSTSP